MKVLILSILLIFLPFSDDYYATVIGVVDGDSIVILTHDNQQIKVRLEGIDCPEPNQDFGEKAKQATVALCFNKTVRIKKSGVDHYGRTLAYVYVNEICINNELLSRGLAWHYKEYNHDTSLMKLEEEARSNKAGLWCSASPTPPWEFRHKKKL